MDSAAKIVASLQAVSAEMGLPERSDMACRNVIGLGLKEAIETLHPGIPTTQIPVFADRYRHDFLVASSQPESLFEGVHDILRALESQQLWLAVATGKSRRGLNRVLSETDCHRYFHSTRCADETCSKPDPQMLKEIIEEFGVEPTKTLMIGDTEYDLEMAQRAGTASLAVSYGAHESHRLDRYASLAKLDSISALGQWLNQNI